MNVVEIHHELCAVYNPNVMSEGTVRQWCRMFMIKSEVVSWPSVVSEEHVQSERWHFKISELSYELLEISCEIITVRLGCHKFYAT
jgi:hypothetical protein